MHKDIYLLKAKHFIELAGLELASYVSDDEEVNLVHEMIDDLNATVEQIHELCEHDYR